MTSESRVPEILIELDEKALDPPISDEGSKVGQDLSEPRHPSTFEYGDDVFDFLRPVHIPVAPISSELKKVFIDRDQTSAEVNKAYLDYMDDFNDVILSQSQVILDVAKLKMEMMFVKYSKPIPLDLPAEIVAPDTVADVAKLPAGFGKRRGGSSSLGGSKKPKTPTESLPDLP